MILQDVLFTQASQASRGILTAPESYPDRLHFTCEFPGKHGRLGFPLAIPVSPKQASHSEAGCLVLSLKLPLSQSI